MCSSAHQLGNRDIPKDWAVCESGINESWSKEDLAKIHWYESNYSDQFFCLKCMLKWKEFDFDKDLDYTDFKKNANGQAEEFKSVVIAPVEEQKQLFMDGKEGDDLFTEL